MSEDLTPIWEAIAEREKTSGRLLADAYAGKPHAFAVVDHWWAEPGVEPKRLILDVETAWHCWFLPTLRNHIAVVSDHVPDICLVHGTVVVAEAFGCEVAFTPGAWPWAKPRLHSIAEVDSLRPPDLRHAAAVQRYLEHIRWLRKRTADRIPIKLHDLQSPFTIAAQLRHYEDLLVDMLDEPARVRKLLEIITDTLIAYLRILKAEYGYASYPGNNYPSLGKDIGFCVADDTALIPLSPAMYEEFCLPTLQRLAQEGVGFFVHSCGCYNHQIDNLLRIPNLRAIQIHSGPGEADPAPAWQKVHGRAALWSDTNTLSLGDAYRGRWWDCYEEYVLPRLLAVGVSGLVIQSPPAPTAAERQANVERLRRILRAAASGSATLPPK